MAAPATYGSLPFSEQISFLQAKQPSADYWKIRRDAHDQAFVSAGANRVDLVADLHAIVTRAIAEGLTLAQFRQDYDAVLDHYSWEPDGGRQWRARVIYETNLRTSYAAGRYAQLQQVKATRPYWVYNHSDAVQHPRELHLLWDGLAIHADNPWWQDHFPPNGYGCCCYVTAYSLAELRYLGKSGPDEAPATAMRQIVHKGEIVQVPEGIDPGWNYVPGRSVFEQLVQGALEKSTRLPAAPAAQMNQELLSNTGVTQAIRAELERLASPTATGRSMTITSMPPAVTAQLQERLPELASPLVRIGADVARRTAAGEVALAGLLNALSTPVAVLFNPVSSRLFYLAALVEGQSTQEVVEVALDASGAQVTSAVRMVLADLQRDLQAGDLQLLDGSL